MFTSPRTWTQGESSIRYDSVNQSLPENLNEFRNLMSTRVSVSTTDSRTIFAQRVSSADRFTVSQVIPFDSATTSSPTATDFWGTGMPTNVQQTLFNSAVLWVPIASINEAKKSTETIKLQVFVSFFYLPFRADGLYENGTTVVECQYMGSDLQSSPGTSAPQTIPLSGSGYNNIFLSSAKVALDTSMVTPGNPSIAAFKLVVRQYGLTTLPRAVPAIGFIGPENFQTGPDRMSNFFIQADVVVE